MTTFGEKLKELREERGKLQKEVGLEAGISNDAHSAQAYISRYERDICRPSVERIKQLNDYFNINLSKFPSPDQDEGFRPEVKDWDDYNTELASERIMEHVEENPLDSLREIAYECKVKPTDVKKVLENEIDDEKDKLLEATNLGEDYAETLTDLLGNVIDIYKRNRKIKSDHNRATQDFLHKFEFLNLNKFEQLLTLAKTKGDTIGLLKDEDIVEGLEAVVELIKSRKKRRKAKNQNRVLKPLYDIFNQREKLLNKVDKAQTLSTEALNLIDAQVYRPKQRFDLFDKKYWPKKENLKAKLEAKNASQQVATAK